MSFRKNTFLSVHVIAFALFIGSVIGTNAQVLPGEGVDSGLGGNNIITGTVLLSTGERLNRRIQVKLRTMMRGDRTALSDDRGLFIFRGVPVGNYQIVIDKEPEFENFQRNIDITIQERQGGSTYTVDVRLTLKPSVQPKPATVIAELADVPQAALVHFYKGNELAGKRQFADAIQEYQKAIAIHPRFMLAYNEIGAVHLRMGEFAKADELFLAALALDPEAFSPLLNRGIALVQLKRYDVAETTLRKALSKDDKSSIAKYFYGQALANLGKFDEAVIQLEAALKDGGDAMLEAHRILAIIYNSRGNKAKAAEALENYLRIAPNAPDAEQLRQLLAQLKGNQPN